MSETNTESQSKKSNSTSKIIIVLFALSIIGNIAQALLGVQSSNEHQEEKINLQAEISQIDSLFNEATLDNNRLKGENEELEKIRLENEAKIEEAKAEVKRLLATVKDEKELARKLRYQLGLIRKLNKELENKVDELLLENKKLADKNTELTDSVTSLSEEKEILTEKVGIASVLRSEYITPKAFRKRLFGDGFKETKLAKRTQKVEVDFSVLENSIAEKGEKKVYLRILSPEGHVLGGPLNSSGSFVNPANGDTLKFSKSKEFTYDGSTQELTLTYEEENEKMFPAGTYNVEIYVDGQKSNEAKFSLK